MKTINHIILLLAFVLAACTDDDIAGGGDVASADDHGIGELVLFSAGSATNTTSRANVIPYMERDGRFVCKMFYHAKATDTEASPFDTISTPVTSWLRVNDDEGNSVYWNRQYTMDADVNHRDYIDYGFDSRAQYFYWRNRLDHVFLGFCDYNQLKSNTYGTEQGKLFMYPEADGSKKTKTGTRETQTTSQMKRLVFGLATKPNPNYSDPAKAEWEASHTAEEPYPEPATIDIVEFKKVNETNPFALNFTDGFPLSYSYTNSSYFALANKTRDQVKLMIDGSAMTDGEKEALKEDLTERQSDTAYELEQDGNYYRYSRWWVYYDEREPDVFNADGTLNLASNGVVIFCRKEKQILEDVIAVAPANTFDLTRGTKTSMAEQPDPLIALTKMKPMGATQEANRVRLYFKHQFSQIQVNLTAGENTAEISDENIVSVELLGVSEKGYVFTNINPNGTQIAPDYEPVVINKYSAEHLKKNQYGTSFNMFAMEPNEKPLTAIKSYNAIAFGQLQAIRITWQEKPTGEYYTDETASEENEKHLVADTAGRQPGDAGYTTKYESDYTPVQAGDVVPPVKHVATYKITVDDRGNSLVNLRSGFRYMYDFELRRGTIAFIRATIVGWQLDDELNYVTSGTIHE